MAEQTMIAVETLRDDQGKNAKVVRCKYCSCTILRPGVATHIVKEAALPILGNAEGTCEPVSDFWHVKDFFDFENMGFNRTVGDTKYLSCADCERGPIGYHLTSDPKNIYLAVNRVIYCD
eukprot:Colp12_sorted_trinity150504_noHs@17965